MLRAELCFALLALLPAVLAFGPGTKCPYGGVSDVGLDPTGGYRRSMVANPERRSLLTSANIDAVKADIKKMLTDSKDFWPADFGNYGPLMIRLAWHCAGSYRSADGRGGCDGARIRFDPERSWDDNTNLDKARTLLWPIKQKYGSTISWGDLIVLAGDTAIESMGGPILGFCAGRIDDGDGEDSIPLGPSTEQEAIAPCPVNGDCKAPLGATTVGLIYVNPEGPLGNPDPAASAPQIRDTFARMGMNDRETVALIGGGHAFGKTHGACPTGAGPKPNQDPANPWPGTCGSGPMKGKGNNTFTSGFEGAWTSTPTKWSNQYFTNLLGIEWELTKSPANHNQWKPKGSRDPSRIMMLTADIALTKDPKYLEIVKEYAENITALEVEFSRAWYKLMTRDMGPYSRCLPGKYLPPPQPFQMPLPPPPARQPNWQAVRNAIAKALTTPSTALAPDMDAAGKPTYTAIFSTLAYQCAATFRSTDYTGGCNGARIRFPPLKDLPVNVDLDKAIKVLEPIKSKYGATTWSDLIVLAGTVANDDAGGKRDRFCPGRSDAVNGDGVAVPFPFNYSDPITAAYNHIDTLGGTPRMWVALAGRPRSPSLMKRQGYSGSWGNDPAVLSNAYYKVLLNEQWQAATSPSGMPEYHAVGKSGVTMTPQDLVLRWDPTFLAIAQEYASDEAKFHQDFADSWTALMNADRFRGPADSECK